MAKSFHAFSCSPERKQRFADDPSLLTRSVYVSGLAWTTTTAALTAHFERAGGVEKAVILSKVRNGKTLSLGCGVVEFSSPEQAALAVTMLNNSELDGRLIRCREDRSLDNSMGDASSGGDLTRSPQVSGKKEIALGDRVLDPKRLFITSLPWNVTSASLLEILSTAGKVVACDVLFTKKGRSLGHAVVELADAATAARVAEQFNGFVIDGRPMVVRAYYTD
jgi:RNA recognition motif-containing protein